MKKRDLFAMNEITLSEVLLSLSKLEFSQIYKNICALTRDFQQSGILTSVASEEPVQPPFRLRNLKWCSVSSLTLIGISSDKQRL